MILLPRDSGIELIKGLFIRSAIFGMERGGTSQFNWNAKEGKETLLLNTICVYGDEVCIYALDTYVHKDTVCFRTTGQQVQDAFMKMWERLLESALFEGMSENVFHQRTKFFRQHMMKSVEIIKSKEIRNGTKKKVARASNRD